MDDWLQQLATEYTLSAAIIRVPDEKGFFIIEGPVPARQLEQLTQTYDQAMREAAAADVEIGRTATRVLTVRLNDSGRYLSILMRPAELDGQATHITGSQIKNYNRTETMKTRSASSFASRHCWLFRSSRAIAKSNHQT